MANTRFKLQLNSSGAGLIGLFGQGSSNAYTVYNQTSSSVTFGSTGRSSVRVVAVARAPLGYPRSVTTFNDISVKKNDGYWATTWTGDSPYGSAQYVNAGTTTGTYSFPITIQDEHGTHLGTPNCDKTYFGNDAYIGFLHSTTDSGYRFSGWTVTIVGTDTSAPGSTTIASPTGYSASTSGTTRTYTIPSSYSGAFIFKPSRYYTTSITVTANYESGVALPFYVQEEAVGKVVLFGGGADISSRTYFFDQCSATAESVVLTASFSPFTSLGVFYAQVTPLNYIPAIKLFSGTSFADYTGIAKFCLGYYPQGAANYAYLTSTGWSKTEKVSVTIQDDHGTHAGTANCNALGFNVGSGIGVLHISTDRGWKFLGWRVKADAYPNASPTPYAEYWTTVSDTEWFLPSTIEVAVCCQLGTAYLSSGITIIAEYEQSATVEVSWMVDGVMFASTDCTEGENYELPAEKPTKDGFSFAGWFTAESGGTQVTAETPFTATSAVMLYAQWSTSPAPTPSGGGTGLMVRSASSDFLVFSASGGALVYDA